MFFAGKFPHKIEAVFCWVQGGFLWVWIMGSRNVMGLGYGSNNSAYPGTKLCFSALETRAVCPAARGQQKLAMCKSSVDA
jgi:hypothetical protein